MAMEVPPYLSIVILFVDDVPMRIRRLPIPVGARLACSSVNTLDPLDACNPLHEYQSTGPCNNFYHPAAHFISCLVGNSYSQLEVTYDPIYKMITLFLTMYNQWFITMNHVKSLAISGSSSGFGHLFAAGPSSLRGCSTSFRGPEAGGGPVNDSSLHKQLLTRL